MHSAQLWHCQLGTVWIDFTCQPPSSLEKYISLYSSTEFDFLLPCHLFFMTAYCISVIFYFCEFFKKDSLYNLEWFIVGFAKSWVERILSKTEIVWARSQQECLLCELFIFLLYLAFPLCPMYTTKKEKGEKTDCSFTYFCLLTY